MIHHIEIGPYQFWIGRSGQLPCRKMAYGVCFQRFKLNSKGNIRKDVTGKLWAAQKQGTIGLVNGQWGSAA